MVTWSTGGGAAMVEVHVCADAVYRATTTENGVFTVRCAWGCRIEKFLRSESARQRAA